ncbi:MAG: ABC transporter permease, partial [Clostridiales bacterium]|nr:ABC transporter permease [Clostridiales bacterium]
MWTDRQRGAPDEAESPAVQSPAAASKARRPATWRSALLLSVSILLALLLLAGLVWLSLRCEKEQYSRLLYAMSLTERSLDTQQIEEFCEEEFLVTYEIERQTSAEVHRYHLPLTQVATNSCYAQVLGYRTLSGGFFSAAAFKAGYREVVLNGSAAFQLFGGYQIIGLPLQMDGASWLVAGVIDDGRGEDDPRVYVPASV